MKLVGIGHYWNDLNVGDTYRTVGRTITEADLVNFITCTGMLEVLFTDIEYLKEHSSIQGRVVPAALLFAFSEGLLIQSTLQHTGLAFLNMEINVEKPSFVGDTIHVECEVVEIKPTSKGRGLVRTANNIVNQRGETAIAYTPLRILAGRES